MTTREHRDFRNACLILGGIGVIGLIAITAAYWIWLGFEI